MSLFAVFVQSVLYGSGSSLFVMGILRHIAGQHDAGRIYLAFGSLFVSLGALATILIIRRNERKSRGRYREASEAHRTGTGGSTGHGTAGSASGGAFGTGAGMNPWDTLGLTSDSWYQQYHQQYRKTISTASTQPPKPRPRAAGEFDGASFAAGVVTGTRSFGVDKLGRLIGVAYKVVWRPGENEAVCMERHIDFNHINSFSYDAVIRPSSKPKHSIAECGHGFYGYYEGSNDYYEPGMVMAVVEGYGETIVGTRGFRASKARIVALHIPQEVSTPTRRLITRNYPDVPVLESFDAMVSEFPPDDAGQGLSPDTDPYFWTREA